MGIREEFEKLEAIDRLVQLCGATYSEITRNYKIKSTGLYDVEVCSFLNGAWYAFQEQQKKIDALKEKIDSALELMRQPMRGTTSDLLADIEDIL